MSLLLALTSAPSGVSGSLAWTSGNDTWALSSTVLVTGSISIQSGNDTWAVASNVRVTGTIAVQSGNDTWSLTGAAAVSGSISFIGQNDTWSLASTVTGGSVSGALSWTSQNDVWALAANVPQQSTLGGVHEERRTAPFAPWTIERGLTPELRAKIRRQLEAEAEPVREVIKAQAKINFESMEAEELALQAAIRAARLEYDALYMRLLAYQRDQMEEEAVVMAMMALL